METEEGEKLPTSFEFEGSVIFITNLDFDRLIGAGHKLTPHLEALVSRSHYLDLAMKSRRHYLIRIKQVVAEGMLKDMGINGMDETILMSYIHTNADKLRELSLRMVVKLATLMKMSRSQWEKIAKTTCWKSV